MSRASLRKQEKEALDILAAKSRDGKLHPKKIVAVAANPRHPLHHRFLWDDSKAALQYRLEQARDLIQVYVTTLPGIEQSCRAYVHVKNGNDGYMPVAAAMKSPEVMERLVSQLKTDLMEVLQRYSYLRKSCPGVFRAVEKVASPVDMTRDRERQESSRSTGVHRT